jgi:CSLREA domain-containing protein
MSSLSRSKLFVFGARLALALTFIAALVLIRPTSAGNSFAPVEAAVRQERSADLTPAAGPLTLVVNTLADVADTNIGDGICDSDLGTAGDQCTLRAAIQEANAAFSDDIINFSLPPGSIISLDSALPDIADNLSINGPGLNTLTVKRSSAAGTPAFRLFAFTGGAMKASISGITMTGGLAKIGDDGGALFVQNFATVKLSNVNITGNATVDGTGFHAGFGAGIANRGNIDLINSTVSNNATGKGSSGGAQNGGDGGGIYNTSQGVINIINSTISGNATGNGAGGHDGHGAGIYNTNRVTLINVTISGNTTGTGTSIGISGQGGAIFSNSGLVKMINCTITNNRAAINGGVTISGSPAGLANTIIANNRAGNSPEGSGVFDVQGFNPIKDASGFSFIGPSPNNITGQDPNLGPLANNGGPTQTHALLSGSPAIDTGSNANLVADTFDLDGDGDTTEPTPFDQRGAIFKRVIDGPDADLTATVDIGAYEFQTTNPIDDPDSFVREQYLDFLNRQPDSSGLAFWTNEITSCGTDQNCKDAKRVNVSAAFFLSIEFQDTGYLVERIYKAAYGSASGTSTFGGTHQFAVPIVRLNEFLPDTQKIGFGVVVGQGNWQQQLDANKASFTAEFVQRPRFTTAFPNTMTAAQFVDALNTNAGLPLSQSERDQLVSDLSTNAKTRAQVLRAVAEDPDLNSAEFNRAFVLMQFFGYLRRNPNDAPDADYTGYDFWLTKLNQFNGNFVNADMVKAFISSTEYRQRFGP